MGKIVRNDIIYGIDEDEIKSTLDDCIEDNGNKIVGTGALKEFKQIFEFEVNEGIDAIYNEVTKQGISIGNTKPYTDILNSIPTICTNRYNAGVSATKKGTAAAAQVRSGYTFTNSSSVNASGTMANYTGSTVRKAFTPGTSSGSYTIPSGYHDGQGTVTCAAISATKKLAVTNGTKVDMEGAYRYVNTKAVYDAGYNAGHEVGKTVSSCSYLVALQSYCRSTNTAWKENKIWIQINGEWKVQGADITTNSYDSGNVGI